MLDAIVLVISIMYVGMVVLVGTNLNLGFRKTKLSFIVMILGSLLWVLSLYYFKTSLSPDISLSAAKLIWSGAVLTVSGVFSFTVYYRLEGLKEKSNLWSLFAVISFVAATSIAFLGILTDQVVSSTIIEQEKINYGYGQLLAVIYIFFGIVGSIISINQFLEKADERQKQSIRLVYKSLAATVSIAFVTNAILPAIIGNSSLSFLAIFATMPVNLVIAQSLLFHQFLDARVLIGRIVYFATVAVFPFSAFFILVLVYESIFGSVFSSPVYIISIFVSFAFVVLFNLINKFIREQVDVRLINPGYDPAEALENFNNQISSTLQLDEISSAINQILKKTIRPSFSEVVVFENTDKAVHRQSFSTISRSNKKDILTSEDTLKTVWKELSKEPILVDRLDDNALLNRYSNIQNLLRDIKVMLIEYDAKVAMPMFTKNNVIGMVLIGKKEADLPYANQDISFLGNLMSTTSVAVERSLLYTEVQEFANTLQGKVDDATKELKQANTKLQGALAEVQEARRKERDMIDVMGHELRTPISIVRNALSMLNRESTKNNGVVNPEMLVKYVDMGLESARREITLIETLLSATKVDASRLQLHLVKVDFKDVINDGIEGTKHMFAEKSLQLNYIKPTQDIFVYCDRTRVQEIMDNFLTNASKYTMKGRVDINIWQDAENGWISVSDTGMGIDEIDLQNLGKKFFRAKQYVESENSDETKIVRPGGTGLGLYVVFELIRVMGGKLYINSTVGKGTTFTFSMPAYKNQEDKQIDQTFEAGSTKQSREHITINGDAPQPPATQQTPDQTAPNK